MGFLFSASLFKRIFKLWIGYFAPDKIKLFYTYGLQKITPKLVIAFLHKKLCSATSTYCLGKKKYYLFTVWSILYQLRQNSLNYNGYIFIAQKVI